jgi:uncharacterized protein (DUF4415 family)
MLVPVKTGIIAQGKHHSEEGMGKSIVKVTVEVEPEVVEWFKAQGDNCERYLAAALRIYAQAHQVPEKAEEG